MSANRHDPLDADERELARVLRALPAGEPPSALDARILAMARDAVVTTPAQKDEAQPRARRAPRFVWGLGVAASCVMAAGLVWRMGGFGAEHVGVAGTPVPSNGAAAESSVQPAPPAPPAPAANAMNAAADRQILRLRDFSAEQKRAPSPHEQVAADTAQESSALHSITVTGSRIVDVEHADGDAGPQTWLQRIRARIERGDDEGARESLEAFRARHPSEPLPQDLIDFRARVEGTAAGAPAPDAG